MARWKACVEFLLSVIELLFLYLVVEALQGKSVKPRCLQEAQVNLSQDFRGKGSSLHGEYFFGFYKTTHILLSDSANCNVLRAVVLTQYRRVTDGRTERQTDRQIDGIAIASTTAIAMLNIKKHTHM